MSFPADNVCILTGNANPQLAKAIADRIGIPLCEAFVGHFNNGEIQVMIEESIRGKDIFIIQPTSYPVNDNLMELLIMTDACKRASAHSITAVVPYYAYARQDRKTRGREPISAKLVADLMTTAGVTRVVTVDLHAGQIQGFFDIPVDHMEALPILAKHFIKQGFGPEDTVVVSPDVGGVKRARGLAKWLHTPLAIIDKRRQKANECEVMNIIGDVDGKKVILVDDMIDTAGTICNAAKALIERGAVKVYACATHAVFSGPAIERLKESVFTKVVVTDSIYLSEEQRFDKLRVLSASEIFAETIKRIAKDEPISYLFEMPAEQC